MSPKAQAPNKEVRELLRKAKAAGLEVERLGSGHYRLSKPGVAETVTLSGTRVGWGTFKKSMRLIETNLGMRL